MRSPWTPEITFPAIAQGDIVQVRGTLRRLPRRRNPADFDVARFLRQRGLYAGWGLRRDDVQPLGGALAMLRPMKGVMIAYQFDLKASEGGKESYDD